LGVYAKNRKRTTATATTTTTTTTNTAPAGRRVARKLAGASAAVAETE
jgi:hypothetical protein